MTKLENMYHTSIDMPEYIENFYYNKDINKLKIIKSYSEDDEIITNIDLDKNVSNLIYWLFYERDDAVADLKKLKQEISECKDLKISLEYKRQLEDLLKDLKNKVEITRKAIKKVKNY